jgi:hypothetical protein
MPAAQFPDYLFYEQEAAVFGAPQHKLTMKKNLRAPIKIVKFTTASN